MTRRKLILLLAGCALTISVIVVLNRNERDVGDLLTEARSSLAEEQFEAARAISDRILRIDAQHPDALLIAGEASVRLNRFEDAVAYYLKVPASGGETYVSAQFAAAEVHRHLGRMSDAEECLSRVLEAAPDHGAAHERLALLLESRGQRWMARQHWQAALTQQRFSTASLRLLADSEARFEPSPAVAGGGASPSQSDLLGAIESLARRDRPSARRLLLRAVQAEPGNVEAHFRLGVLLTDESPEKIPAWNRQLPANANDHPGIWRVRGLWSQHAGQDEAAARCYWETIQRDPLDRTATFQLAQLVQQSEGQPVATALSRRADRLLRLSILMHRLDSRPGEVSSLAEMARLLDEMGRRKEAAAWCHIALSTAAPSTEIEKRLARLTRLTSDDPGTEVSQADALMALDLSELPLPAWGLDTEPADGGAASRTQIHFQDQAQEAGLVFRYENDNDPGTGTEGMKMYSFTGGGIGVIDFDHDGWPDITCTQGGDWNDPRSKQFNDRLFRNLDGESFVDVSGMAGVGTAGFSQGVACGDINNDGWADVYVARIGRNCLYLNNGDGTFSDVTESIEPVVERWTTSCLIADLDGDGNSELLDINYLRGNDVFDRLCDYEGNLRACAPGDFEFERDDLWMNNGRGDFTLAHEPGAGFSKEPRPGLGAIAADFDGSGELGLFVANDALANWFYQPDRVDDGTLRFDESATLQGVGVDRDGRAQACMGIACSDVDGNGSLDIFVTNYYQEHNTLYLSRDTGFVDAARESRLFGPSLPVLGFGTQFLDADLDGWDDLIVANGHVDDFSFDGIPFQMSGQFFRNHGRGIFTLLSPQQSGEYFQRKGLGRSVASVDWNRDGRPDVVVMHLDAPVALLTNDSPNPGRALVIRLVATQSQRDACGTQVTVQLDDGRSITRQLVAGSGYQASNEPVLIFGLGSTAAVSGIDVKWRSGATTAITTGVSSASELILVEGSDWQSGVQ